MSLATISYFNLSRKRKKHINQWLEHVQLRAFQPDITSVKTVNLLLLPLLFQVTFVSI